MQNRMKLLPVFIPSTNSRLPTISAPAALASSVADPPANTAILTTFPVPCGNDAILSTFYLNHVTMRITYFWNKKSVQ